MYVVKNQWEWLAQTTGSRMQEKVVGRVKQGYHVKKNRDEGPQLSGKVPI